MEKKSYCDWCFITFGSAEPREKKGENVYHSCCLKRLELQELIVKEVKRNEKKGGDANCMQMRQGQKIPGLGFHFQ